MSRERAFKLFLTIAFLSVSIAIFTARSTPNTYEYSIYTENPAIWAVLIASLVCFLSIGYVHGRLLSISVFGSIITSFAIVAMPLIRNYYFYGEFDALTHLSRVRHFHTADWVLIDLLSPHLLTLSAVLVEFGFSPRRALLLIPSIIALVYFLFIPLCLRTLSTDWNRGAFIVSLGVAFILLPVDAYATRVNFHPFSQAILLLPLILFPYLAYQVSGIERHRYIWWVLMFSLVFIHPFVAFVVTSVFIGSESFRAVTRYKIENRAPFLRAYHFPIILLSVIWFARMVDHNKFHIMVRVAAVNIVHLSEVGFWITSKTSSVEESGYSLSSVIGRMFGPSIVFLIIGVAMGLVLLQKFRSQALSNEERTALNVGIGFLPIIPIFMFLFVAQIGDFTYRLIGVFAVATSIFGGLGVIKMSNWLRMPQGSSFRHMPHVFIIIVLIFSIFTIHASPFLLRTNQQVEESYHSGYSQSFQYESPSASYSNIRSPEYRYRHAVEGPPQEIRLKEQIAPDHFADHDLPGHYRGDTYLAITAADEIRDPIVYNGLRFTKEDFQYLETDPDINRIRDNGGYELYLVNGQNSSIEEG